MGAETRLLKLKLPGSGGIRTRASEETGALNQRLRPLGHATHLNTMKGFIRVLSRLSNCDLHASLSHILKNKVHYFINKTAKYLSEVGFEPTPTFVDQNTQ